MRLSGTFALALCAVISKGYAEASEGSNVVILTGGNFEKETQASTGMTTGDWFVKFYAPWCGHCNRLAPTWDELASELKGKVNVANVDCTAHGDLCKKFEVKGYPTLLHFNGGKYYKFKGARDLETLAKFAVGGFIAVDGTNVPGSTHWLEYLSMEMLMTSGRALAKLANECISECVKDIQNMIETGQRPSDRTISVLGGVLVVLAALVMFGLFSSGEEEKPGEASAKKKD